MMFTSHGRVAEVTLNDLVDFQPLSGYFGQFTFQLDVDDTRQIDVSILPRLQRHYPFYNRSPCLHLSMVFDEENRNDALQTLETYAERINEVLPLDEGSTERKIIVERSSTDILLAVPVRSPEPERCIGLEHAYKVIDALEVDHDPTSVFHCYHDIPRPAIDGLNPSARKKLSLHSHKLFGYALPTAKLMSTLSFAFDS